MSLKKLPVFLLSSAVSLLLSVVMACDEDTDPASQDTGSSTDITSEDPGAEDLGAEDIGVDEGSDSEPDNEPDQELPEYTFDEFEWLTQPPDPSIRICDEAADPAGAADKIFISCDIEGESFARDDVEPQEEIVVLTYNILRGFEVDAQVEMIRDDPRVPYADVLLLSEVDRGCPRTDGRHIAREYAQGLEMSYLYAVEFVELTEDPDNPVAECEHGNAILSRYPLGNVRQIRHAEQQAWYGKDENRLGGRIALAADVLVGDKVVHVYAVHFESDLVETTRAAQATEIAEDGLELPYLVVVGGDMNSGMYYFDLIMNSSSDETIRPFFERGYWDAHGNVDPANRITYPDTGFILDVIMVDADAFVHPGMCPADVCGELSDHLPIWTTIIPSRWDVH